MMSLEKKIKSFLRRRAVVLMYHRVADVPKDPWELAVSTENFEQQLQVLSAGYNIISVKELIGQIYEGEIERNSVCITFDDTYRDNIVNAVPLLKKYNCPATFFVPTGLTGTEKMFWWDALYDVMGENYLETWRQLQPLPLDEINRRLELIIGASGKKLTDDSLNFPMSRKELDELSSDKLFSLAVHTITHPALGMHTIEVQEKELLDSREELYSEYDNYVDVVAYPYGNYNSDTLAVMRNNNFEAGFTTEEKSIGAASDIYRLGRFHVKNINGKLFKEQLFQWISQ